jgi:outer membrane protein assembly factor BamB
MTSRNVRTMRAMGFAGFLASIAGAGLVGGCSSPQMVAGRKAMTPAQRKEAFPTNYDEYAKIGYRPDWTGYPAASGRLPVQLMKAYSDTVVTVEGNTVSILEANTGTKRCSTELGGELTRFVGIARDPQRVFVASDSDVYVIDTQTCNMVGRQKIEKIVATDPVMYGDLLIFGTDSGEVLAHLTRSAVGGVKAWGFAMNGAVERKPVLIGSTVGVVSQSGQVVFLDALSGALVGKNFVYSGLAVDPVADEHLMYVASLDQSIYAFNPVDGSLMWRVRTASPLKTQPTAFGGRLYVSVPGQGLTAYDSANGQVVWTSKSFNGTVVAAKGAQLVGFDKATSEAVTIDRDRGDIMGRAKMTGAMTVVPDAFENGNLYVLSTSGLVGKFMPISAGPAKAK